MAAQLPSWIETSPEQFAQAGEAGIRNNIAYQKLDASEDQQAQNQRAQQEMQLRAASSAAQLNLQKQRLQQDQALKATQLSMQKSNADRQFQLSATQSAVNAELQKSRLDQAAKSAGLKFQQQQQYQQAIQQIMQEDPNVSPEEAAIKAGFMTGYSTPELARSVETRRQMMQPNPVTDPATGDIIGYSDASGRVNYIPKPKTAADVPDSVTSKAAELEAEVPGSGEAYILNWKRFKGASSGDASAPAPDGSPQDGVLSRYKIITPGGDQPLGDRLDADAPPIQGAEQFRGETQE